MYYFSLLNNIYLEKLYYHQPKLRNDSLIVWMFHLFFNIIVELTLQYILNIYCIYYDASKLRERTISFTNFNLSHRIFKRKREHIKNLKERKIKII